MAAREAHLARMAPLKATGQIRYAGALLDDAGRMVGTLLLCDFPSRQALEDWLNDDPYVTGDVWRKREVVPFRTAPPFIS